MISRASALSRACVAAAWLMAAGGCNALTGVGDLAVGETGEDAGGPAPQDAAVPPQDAASVPDAFFDGPFAHHRTITLTARVAAKAPILLTLPATFTYASVKTGGDDIRFSSTAARTDDIPYFIESWNVAGESRVWLRPASVPSGGSGTLHMFYGNASAGAASSFAAVFPSAQRTAGGGAGSFTAPGNIDVDWFELRAGDTLTLPLGAPLQITAARIILAGTIEGNGRGSPGGGVDLPGSGPGGGGAPKDASGSGGGGYGGAGGKGGSDASGGGAGGTVYGTATADDIAMGSGAGSAQNRLGGAGGGGVSLIGWSVSGGGTIRVNGLDGQGADGQNAGGGSGGGILVAGVLLDLGGATLTANGGNGGTCVNAANDGGGGGGGGRIKLRHGALYVAPTTTTTTRGAGSKVPCAAAAGQDGSVGTVDVSTTNALSKGYDAALGAEDP